MAIYVSRCGVVYFPVFCRSGIPNPRGHGQVPVHGLLGTGLHSRRWVVGERAKLHVPLPFALQRSHYPLNHHPPPPVCGKIVSVKPVPGAKKVGDRCYRWCAPNRRCYPYLHLSGSMFRGKISSKKTFESNFQAIMCCHSEINLLFYNY